MGDAIERLTQLSMGSAQKNNTENNPEWFSALFLAIGDDCEIFLLW
jgi:hypothetical protein